MSVLERLRQFAQMYDLSIQRIEIAAGLANGSIVKAANRGNFTDKMIDAILNAYPYMSRSWLVDGEGDMVIGGEAPKLLNSIATYGNNNKSKVSVPSSNKDVVEVLKRQLDEKQRIIDSLLRQIDTLHAIIEKQCK